MKEQTTIWQRVRRWAKRLCIVLGVMLGAWVLIVAIGMIPVNNDFVEPEDGIEIIVVSNAVHADLVLPLSTETCDWRDHFPAGTFAGDVGLPSHVAIGWGDQGFFIDTPTWDDLKVSTAANALLWLSPTCIHVQMIYFQESNVPAELKSIRISREQYADLVAYILDAFKTTEGGDRIQIPGASYGQVDAFFEAKGSYHLMNTCNSWVGRGLRTAKVCTGIMTPLPGTPTWYFPN